MKKALIFGLVVGFLFAPPIGDAEAADNVACAVTTSTSASTTTALPASGVCDWSPGSVLLMQCTTDVYVNTNQVRGVFPPDGGTTGGSATSADQRVDFSATTDPYIIYLNNNDHHVSLRAVSSAGSCKFFKTQRARPWR